MERDLEYVEFFSSSCFYLCDSFLFSFFLHKKKLQSQTPFECEWYENNIFGWHSHLSTMKQSMSILIIFLCGHLCAIALMAIVIVFGLVCPSLSNMRDAVQLPDAIIAQFGVIFTHITSGAASNAMIINSEFGPNIWLSCETNTMRRWWWWCGDRDRWHSADIGFAAPAQRKETKERRISIPFSPPQKKSIMPDNITQIKRGVSWIGAQMTKEMRNTQLRFATVGHQVLKKKQKTYSQPVLSHFAVI